MMRHCLNPDCPDTRAVYNFVCPVCWSKLPDLYRAALQYYQVRGQEIIAWERLIKSYFEKVNERHDSKNC